MKKFYKLLLFLAVLSVSLIQTFAQTQISTSGTYLVPAGITTITKVEVRGAGGAGAGATVNISAGGGGGGGAYLSSNSVSVGSSFTVTIGTGGTGAATAGVAGGSTIFTGISTLTAGGGSGGGLDAGGGGAGGAGGTATGGTPGSNGSAGNGGGSGNGGAGGNAGGTGGGAGGVATTPTGTELNGNSGTIPGGAGGGGFRKTTGNATGGSGADGRVDITLPTCPTYSFTSVPTVTGNLCDVSNGVTVTVAGSAGSLPTGTYTVTYRIDATATTTATMTVTMAGTGSFQTSSANLAAGSHTVTITQLASGTAPLTCTSIISTNNVSASFITSNSTAPNNATGSFTGNTICAGGTGILAFDAIDLSYIAPYTVFYTDGATTWSTLIGTASATTFNVAVNPTVTTTYTITKITNGNGCETITGFGDATAQVTVNAIPTISSQPSTSAANYCINSTSTALSVTATAGSGTISTYQWYGNGTNSNSGGTLVATHTSAATTDTYTPLTTSAGALYYYVVITNSNNCTKTSNVSGLITVNANPTATASSNSPICAGATLNLMSGGGTSYAWTGVNSFSSATQNPSISNATTAASGGYTLSVTNASGCTNAVTTSVIVNPTPVTPTATGGTVTLGNSITLTATGCTSTLKWYETLTNNLVTMPVSPTVTTQYYAKCEVTANGITCISAKSNDVTVTVIYEVYVNIANTNPTQDGTSWATAFSSLQAGLAAAFSGVEVWVAQGIYKPTTTTTRTISFNIPNNVKVYGGFIGTETAFTQRNATINPTILSGEIGNSAIYTDNSYHVVTFNGASTNTVLDGFIIRDGNANFDPKVNSYPSATVTNITNDTGAGIALDNSSSPTIANCTLRENRGIFGGAIFAINNSKPIITACKLLGNEATFGSGMYLAVGSDALVNNSQLSGNKALGSIYADLSSPVLTNCTIAGNGGNTAGIYTTSGSSPVIKNSIIWGNSPPYSVSSTQLTITNSIVQGGYVGIGNLNMNPQFVNLINDQSTPSVLGDYHVLAVSPAIDRGVNGTITLTDTDLDGNLRRYNGGTVDMGAYEFQGNATVTIVISIATGFWDVPSTWNVNRVPQIGDIVIIDTPHTVTLNGVGNAKSIEQRGRLILNITNNLLKLGF